MLTIVHCVFDNLYLQEMANEVNEVNEVKEIEGVQVFVDGFNISRMRFQYNTCDCCHMLQLLADGLWFSLPRHAWICGRCIVVCTEHNRIISPHDQSHDFCHGDLVDVCNRPMIRNSFGQLVCQ